MMAAWRMRLATGEAMVLLLLGRLLVNRCRLARWRSLLGRPLDPAGPTLGPARKADGAPRLLGACVERAAWRLGGNFKCLPKALCAHWMLRRRGLPSRLVLAALPGPARGTPDDLHAWTETESGVVIGESAEPFVPVGQFGG